MESTNYPEINIQSENINFQEKILHIKWCPSMDLLAIVNSSYKLTVYRTTWIEDKFVLQKIWAINSTLCQTSIEWRPDGKIIAIGYIDGSLKLIDVETSQIAYSLTHFTKNAYITSMTWLEETYTKNPNQIMKTMTTSLENDLPNLSKIPNSQQFNISQYSGEIFSNNSKMGTTLLSEKIHNNDDKIDILLIYDNKGQFHMSMFGLFYLGSIDITKDTMCNIKNPYIVSSYLSIDFHYISLIVISADSENDILSGKLENELNQYSNNSRPYNLKAISKKYKLHKMTFDTNIIFKKKKKIRSLAIKLGNMISHLNYIYSGIKNMKSEYEGKVKITNDNLKKFSEVMEDFAVFTPPITEFIITFVTGLPTQSVRHYLSNELKEKGIKNWERILDVTYSNIYKLIIEYVQPGCERLLYYLSDLLGFCKWDEQFTSLGIVEADIKQFIVLTGSLIGMLEEISIEIKKLRKNLNSFFAWLQSVLNIIVNEDAKPPIVEDSKGILDFLHTAFSNSNNILDKYFIDINEDGSVMNNDIQNNEDSKSKTSKKEPETIFDIAERIDMNSLPSLSSKLENWEEYIYQEENERNNNENISRIFSEFGNCLETSNENNMDTRNTLNTSFNIFNENNSILNENENYLYNNRRKFSDEGIQNSPKKQCVSLDDEDNMLINYNDSINEKDNDDKVIKNSKKRSCNIISDALDNNQEPIISLSNYKYQGKRLKPVFSNKSYADNPIKYTFPKHNKNQISPAYKNISLMSLVLEVTKKGKEIILMPSHIIGRSLSLIYSFSVTHDNQTFKSVIIDNETRFDEENQNFDNEFGNNSISTEIEDEHYNNELSYNMKNEGYLICKFYCGKKYMVNYTAFNLYDKNKRITGQYLYIFKFKMKKMIEGYKENNNKNNENNNKNSKVITEITAIKTPKNARILDFEFYNDKLIICLVKYENKDGNTYKIGWVNYYKTKFTSLSQMILNDYNNLQLTDFLEISKLKAYNLHLHNSITINSITPQFLRISLKRGLLCVVDKKKKGVCVFTIEENS
ncbi:hypothetical protein BCR36DRAFT_330321 [Piromyces finnis]|uniref:Anaphase-promoting complex subunit 4 n=1 Tax=Piromyces finnis TaxID=1754191 RepID=A0A1Y1V5Y6_9FUNG|nr:hypothetical protein BCR36DRAFT_330321 [Piromyces finnis]|eukprot:ORX47576.1 hypothetical protein BCR36DRAFT_330321 [Piromyces finnis]